MTLLGIVIDVRLLQFSKAPLPIEVTLLGIVIDVMFISLHMCAGMCLTFSPKVKDIICFLIS